MRRCKVFAVPLLALLSICLWPAPHIVFARPASQYTAMTTTTTTSGAWCSAWNVVPGQNLSPAEDQLRGVAALSPTNVWAVGIWSNSVDGPYNPLIEHWNGTAWSVVSAPTPDNSQSAGMTAVAAASANDIWAIGSYSDTVQNVTMTLIEHWNGTSWSIVPSPNPTPLWSATLASVVADASNDAWAVGSYYNLSLNTSQTLIEHWNGTSWSIVASPNVQGTNGAIDNDLEGVTALSNNDMWAVGDDARSSATLIEHWNGTSWSILPSANTSLPENVLNSVTAIASNNVWAVGTSSTNAVIQPLVEHWDGSTWATISAPSLSSSYSLASQIARVPNTGQLWMVGEAYNGKNIVPLTERWNGIAWTSISSASGPSRSNYIYSVSADAANDAWAVGSYDPNLPPNSTGRGKVGALTPSGHPYGGAGASGDAVLILHYTAPRLMLHCPSQ